MMNLGKKAFIAAVDLVAKRRVKIDASRQAEYADADDAGDGVTLTDAKAGEPVTVHLFCAGGTLEIESAGVFAVGPVYAAADGKVQALPGGAGTYLSAGRALEDSGSAGELIEINPVQTGISVVVP